MRRNVVPLALSMLLLIAAFVVLIIARGDGEPPVPTSGADAAVPAPPQTEAEERSRVRRADADRDSGSEAEPVVARGKRVVLVTEIDLDDLLASSPIAGAHVMLRDSTGREFRGTTDAEGRVSLDDVALGVVTVAAAADGFVSDGLDGRGGHIVAISLQRAVHVSGRVVDPSGEPVAGASVFAASGERLDVGDEGDFYFPPISAELGRRHGGTTTDADGRFVLDAIPPHRPLAVSARSDRLGPAHVIVTAGAPDASAVDVTIEIAPAGTLTGVVSRPDGDPAAGALVCAVPVDETETIALLATGDIPRFGMGIARARVVRTAPDGRYRLDGLIHGTAWWVVATIDGLAPSVAESSLTTTPAAPSPVRDFRLRQRGKLRVRIFGPDGEPVPETWASISGSAGWGGSSVPGSAVHEFWSLVPEEITLRVGAPGHPPETRQATVPQNDTLEVTIRLVQGLDFAIRVVDPAGHPVAGAQVALTHEVSPGATDSGASTTTGADGVAQLSGLRAARHTVLVTAATFARSNAEVDVPGSFTTDRIPVDVTLARGGVIRIRIEGARPHFGVVEASGPVEEICVLDEKTQRGELRVPPGRYTVTLWNEDRSTVVDVEDGATVEAVIPAK